MTRNILSILVSVLILTSCGNKTVKNNAVAGDQPVKVEFAALTANPADYIGKNISVEGKVVHVCAETGKKLFIVGDNPNVMLYVQAGDNNEKFPMGLMGSKVSVEGRLQRVATAEKPAAEPAGMKMEMGMEMGKGGACCDTTAKSGKSCCDTTKKAAAECETEAAMAKQTVLSDLMMVYNKHIVVK
jgi:hypothetical protein